MGEGGEWGCMVHYFEWVEVDGALFWVGGGRVSGKIVWLGGAGGMSGSGCTV